MNEVGHGPSGEYIKGIIPWMTPELLEWFKQKGYLIDCETGKIYFGRDFTCWMMPNENNIKSTYRDRFSVLVWANEMKKKIIQKIRQDKLLAMAVSGQNN